MHTTRYRVAGQLLTSNVLLYFLVISDTVRQLSGITLRAVAAIEASPMVDS
jgi:hypothetical protein